jgi:hypothetical protein
VGASSAGGGASGCDEESTDSAKAKIKAATHMVAGLNLITAAAIVHWNTCRSSPQTATSCSVE